MKRTLPLLVAAGFGSWLLATAASQHPHRVFDRFRKYDTMGLLIPNWRFFAPEPAQHDFHILFRVLTTTGEETPWEEAAPIADRRWQQMLWFPGRRQEKAMFDICSELIGHMANSTSDVTDTPAYLTLRDMVERAVRRRYADQLLPSGFQFLIARYSGYDEGQEPEYILASPFVALQTEETW